MTNKHFTILILVIFFVSMVAGGGAQSGTSSVFIPAQTTISACTWPSPTVATITNGGAICMLSLSTGPALAIAVNNGAFVQIPMSAATGVTSFNGRTGNVTLTKADVTGTGLAVSTTVTSTAVSTPQ